MTLKTYLALPVVLAMSLVLTACGENKPAAPAATTAATTDAAATDKAAADKAAADKAAADKAAADKAAADKAAADKAAADKAAADKAAADKAAADKAAADKAAADAAAAAPAATDAAAKGAADAKAAVDASANAMAPAAEVAAGPGKLPATGLKPDTLLASKAKTDKVAYLGVWATDAAACATVDQAGATGYVVVSGLSVRQGSEITLATPTALEGGKASLGTAEKPLDITMPTADTLSVNGGAALVRCTP